MRPRIDEPRPTVGSPPPPVAWPIRRLLGCCPEAGALDHCIGDLLLSRRSIRQLAPAPLRDVLALVGLVTIDRLVKAGDPFGRSRRVTPSAGALHPVGVVVIRGGRARPSVLRIDPASTRVQLLWERAPGGAARLLARLPRFLPEAHGTLLVLLADRWRVASAYRSPDSLLWRDAGALLATLQVAAPALGLRTCPMGLLGQEMAHALFPRIGRMTAVGACIVGRPAPPA